MKQEKLKLSDQERKYYRGVIIPWALHFYKANPGIMVRDMAEAVKMSFTPDFVHSLLKQMFNRGKSTNDIQHATPEDFLMAIWAHFNERGGDIPRPNEGGLDAICG